MSAATAAYASSTERSPIRVTRAPRAFGYSSDDPVQNRPSANHLNCSGSRRNAGAAFAWYSHRFV
jgi:hypothetical protein